MSYWALIRAFRFMGVRNRDHIFEFNFETSPGYLAMRETIEPINILADIGGFFSWRAQQVTASRTRGIVFFSRSWMRMQKHIDPNKARAPNCTQNPPRGSGEF